MSWTSTIKIIAAAAAFAATGAAIAGTIVIRAEGPSKRAYPPGKALGPRITLGPGDRLVVLDAQGTRTLSGPGTIDLAAANGTAAPSALTALIRNSGTRQVRTGAVRGTSTAATARPNLWYADVAHGGIVCLPDLSRGTLWRGAMTDAATLTLTRMSDGKSVPIAFAAGQSVRAWPVAELALAEGVDYRLSGTSLAKPTTLRFAAVGGANGTADAVASSLIEKGCSGQLDQLVAAGAASAPTS